MPAQWSPATPRDWVAGELVTATLMNQEVRDRMMYLKASPAFEGNVTIAGTLAVTGATTLTGTLTGPAEYHRPGATSSVRISGGSSGGDGANLIVFGSSHATNANKGQLNATAGWSITGDLLFTDATYDIGKSGATRPRDGFFSRNFAIGGTLAVTGDTTMEGAISVGNGVGFPVTISANGNLTASLPATMPWVPLSDTYNDGDTTPTVQRRSAMEITNTAPTTITNFDNGTNGQIIILNFTDGNTTINRANAVLAGGVNFVSSAGDVLVLKLIGSTWTEVCRSVNS